MAHSFDRSVYTLIEKINSKFDGLKWKSYKKRKNINFGT